MQEALLSTLFLHVHCEHTVHVCVQAVTLCTERGSQETGTEVHLIALLHSCYKNPFKVTALNNGLQQGRSARTSNVFFLCVTVSKMTTITSSRGHTEVVSARRTDLRDVSDIISLFSHFTEDVFGRIDIMHLL